VLSIIVAMARNRVIGAQNRLPWHLPAELRRFKAITMGHHIIMGRRTWESIGRLLPGRTTVVVTRNPDYRVPGAIVAHSLAQAIRACEGDDEVFVIGGEAMFREALPLADRIYLTRIDAELAGDTFFPEVDLSRWRETDRQEMPAGPGNPLAWTYARHDRAEAGAPR